ncbi:hypothetical protein BVX97_01750 [bacterium E08(2017)]|nr:hypothetical protein BVX97_01750 [bacterium E08(2017)]
MPVIDIAYLGPVGTYSHLVAQKRFGSKANVRLVPMPTIYDICAYTSGKDNRYGIVPIENSSGGAIYETVDILLANKPRVHLLEEITLKVNLALLGHKHEKIQKLYSHFAPMEHCADWIKKNLPRAQKEVVTSTAVAALNAASHNNAAALGSRKLAGYYYLEVLKYPVESDVPNLTNFLVLSGKKKNTVKPTKTTLAVHLPNKPGSLCSFLECFRDNNVNLSRLISRPIRGSHKQYAFLVDIEGASSNANVKKAMIQAQKVSEAIRTVGSYPCSKKYNS